MDDGNHLLYNVNDYQIIQNDVTGIGVIFSYMNKEETQYLFEVGERLRKYRVVRDMTQEVAAALIGISQTQYSKIERGVAKPSLITIFKILKAFDELSGDYLLAAKEPSKHECMDITRYILENSTTEMACIFKNYLELTAKVIGNIKTK